MSSRDNPILNDFRLDLKRLGHARVFKAWGLDQDLKLTVKPLKAFGETQAHADQALAVIPRLYGVWKSRGLDRPAGGV